MLLTYMTTVWKAILPTVLIACVIQTKLYIHDQTVSESCECGYHRDWLCPVTLFYTGTDHIFLTMNIQSRIPLNVYKVSRLPTFTHRTDERDDCLAFGFLCHHTHGRLDLQSVVLAKYN